jgi:NADPH-dependent glutamate synthase beta subunit-like oxidoreductase
MNKPAVTIKNIEVSIIDKGYENGWVIPRAPSKRTGKLGPDTTLKRRRAQYAA